MWKSFLVCYIMYSRKLNTKEYKRGRLPLIDPGKLTSVQNHHDAGHFCSQLPHPVIRARETDKKSSIISFYDHSVELFLTNLLLQRQLTSPTLEIKITPMLFFKWGLIKQYKIQDNQINA